MDNLTINKDYIRLYTRCEEFLCKSKGIERDDLRLFIKGLLKGQYLEEIFHALENTLVEDFDDPIETPEAFIAYIDHYDNYIQLNRRDQTGSYYTPQPIVAFMVDNVLNEFEIKKKLERRERIRILEPSCGTMVFIRQLMKEIYRRTNDWQYVCKLFKEMVTIDLQAEPLFLGVLGIIYYMDIDVLSDCYWNVRCTDTLKIEDLKGQVDLVIGNPPYLGEKGNGAFFRSLKDSDEMAKYYEGRMDLYYFFIHKAIELMTNEGVLSFITTNYFVTSDSGKKLRNNLYQSGVFTQLVDFSGKGFFKSARGQHNLSFIYRKKEPTAVDQVEVVNVGQDKEGNIILRSRNTIEERKIYDEHLQIIINGDAGNHALLTKIKALCNGVLSDKFDVKQGIVSGADFVTKSMMEKKMTESDRALGIEKGDPIYVFPIDTPCPFEGSWKSFYKNSDITPYRILSNPKYKIYYVDEKHPPSEEGISYLEKFKSVLDRRREVKLGYRKWYELQWPRNAELFEQPKLVMPQRSMKNVFAYTDYDFYGSADIYYIIHENRNKDALMYLNGVMNSKLYYFWLYHRGKKKGDLLELYSTPIKNLPLIHFQELPWQLEVLSLVQSIIGHENPNDKMLERLMNQIDSTLYEGFSLTEDEIERVEELYRQID